MKVSRRNVARHLVLGLSTLLAGIIIAGCSGSGTSSVSITPKPKSVTPIVTSAPPMTLQKYTGKGFTIDHPQDWRIETASNTVAFKDVQGNNILSITRISNPGGKKRAKEIADATLLLLEAGMTDARTISVSPSVIVGGKTWIQHSIAGTLDTTGEQKAPGRTILLVSNHPEHSSSTQTYEIIYSGPDLTFERINVIFQTMIQSFKFTN